MSNKVKIKVIKSKPGQGQRHIEDLVGKEYEVRESDINRFGEVTIQDKGNYVLNGDEYTVIE